MTLFYPSMAMLVCIFMATLLVAPLQSAEGSYVDKPVCDVCSCFNSDVICRTHLPTPARWKDLDEKWTEVKITEMDDLTKLEKGAFDGLTVRRLHIYENPDLESIEAGTVDDHDAASTVWDSPDDHIVMQFAALELDTLVIIADRLNSDVTAEDLLALNKDNIDGLTTIVPLKRGTRIITDLKGLRCDLCDFSASTKRAIEDHQRMCPKLPLTPM